MRKIHNKNLLENARELRRAQTPQERKLWYEFLCTLPVRFTRQKIIDKYIVDFCCASKKIIVELDGSQHYEGHAPEYDAERDQYLQSLGYVVLRYTNIEFDRNFRGVCEDIWNHLGLE